MDRWPLHRSFTLTALPNAAFWARRFVEEALEQWGFDADEAFAYRVKLVATELVTNAAKASGTLSDEEGQRYNRCPMSLHYAELARLGYVRLRLFSDGWRQILIVVWDKSNEPPIMRWPGMDEECGRGLLLVQDLCTRWGWQPVRNDAKHHGKVVWATLTAETPASPR
jgi:two-component sensor histidine kinase